MNYLSQGKITKDSRNEGWKVDIIRGVGRSHTHTFSGLFVPLSKLEGKITDLCDPGRQDIDDCHKAGITGHIL